uniref:eIF3h C-terminal domain-containing protein n=1 Tax=Aotus nancymaae TaxID=37293 RepID=A0A2K5EZM6_AOTNA
MASHKEGTGSTATSSSSTTSAAGKGKGKGGSRDSAMKQINSYCQNIKEFTAQNLGKLFMAQALQEYN